jgi:hypothetical protein
MPIDSDDPDDWIDPSGAVSRAGAAFGAPSGATNRALDPTADPFAAYWSRVAGSQAGAAAWAPTLFPNTAGPVFNNPSPSWPSNQRSAVLQTPYAGFLEGLRYLGGEPGEVPYAGFLEGLRYLGPPNLSIGSWPSSSALAQATPNTPTETPDQRRPIGDYSTGEIAGDTAKSFGVGVGRGALQLGGMPGDIRETIASGVQRGADYLAPGYAPRAGAFASGLLAWNPLSPVFRGPTSAQLQGSVESVTGPFYQPKTVLGDYGQTAGEFLPGALVPEGGLATRVLRNWLLPAVSSETAGQVTQGTPAEHWARIAAAILGGAAGPRRALPSSRSAPEVAEALPPAARAGGNATSANVGIPKDVPQVALNRAAGYAWESEAIQNRLAPAQDSIQPQVTFMSNGPSGLRVRLDAVGTDKLTGKIVLSDMKASATAPLTSNQTIVYPELEQFGAAVVGKGKFPYVGGTKIPPTRVDIVRKSDQ